MEEQNKSELKKAHKHLESGYCVTDVYLTVIVYLLLPCIYDHHRYMTIIVCGGQLCTSFLNGSYFH